MDLKPIESIKTDAILEMPSIHKVFGTRINVIQGFARVLSNLFQSFIIAFIGVNVITDKTQANCIIKLILYSLTLMLLFC